MASHSVTVNTESSATSGTMDNCTIRAIGIMKTDIRNSTLYYVEIQTSKITDCKLHNCKVFNSTVKTSELFDTRLHESVFEKSKLSGCNITMSPLAFRRFPVEIRTMIFELSVELDDGKSPALLIALRSDAELYHEAIDLFYKSNFFLLNRSTMSSCNKLSQNAISNISKLSIDCRVGELRYSAYQDLPKCIVDNAKIKELYVLGYYSTIGKWIKAAIKQLGTVKKLIVEIDSSWDEWPGCRLEYLDTQFGVSPTKLEVDTPKREQWVWKISEDKDLVLKW